MFSDRIEAGVHGRLFVAEVPSTLENKPIPHAAPSRLPRAKKSLGQHFLVDRGVLRRIVEAADLSPADVVVEIGPGQGLLTRELAAQAGRVIAVELDDALAARLMEEFKSQPHVSVIHADAREVDIEALVEPGTPFKLVANLPYYAASPIIRRFLRATHKPSLMVVMVQREVAREMAAQPDEMGFLSLTTQLYAKPRLVCTVPPGAFRPRPKVASAVLRLDTLPRLALDVDHEERFIEMVRAGFSAPRKQLHNCIRKGLDLPPDAVGKMLAEAGVEPTRRAETLSMAEWGALYRAFKRLGPAG